MPALALALLVALFALSLFVSFVSVVFRGIFPQRVDLVTLSRTPQSLVAARKSLFQQFGVRLGWQIR